MNLHDEALGARLSSNSSGTKVGCAILTERGNLLLGWNIVGTFATSIHAEVNAISKLQGEKIRELYIVSNADFFTPCGACMDWIMQFGPDCTITISNLDGQTHTFAPKDLMPHYPQRRTS